jgi:hypothetical protein
MCTSRLKGEGGPDVNQQEKEERARCAQQAIQKRDRYAIAG